MNITHGEILPIEFPASMRPLSHSSAPTNQWPFWFMFEDLQKDPNNLSKVSGQTVTYLRKLGSEGMVDPGGKKIPGVPIPAIHTYFGQFVDHDITLEKGSSDLSLENPTPFELIDIKAKILNSRTPNLDLDNVYGPDLLGVTAPRDVRNLDKLEIGPVSTSKPPSTGTDIWRDLPRFGDGTPKVGDTRDDQHLIISQLHVAFLRAHNAIVDRGSKFDQAKRLLIQHYQWIILDDFLERIADPNIVKKVRRDGPKFYHPTKDNFFVPLEFSAAAFRFGHSKIRPSYDEFSKNQGTGGLDLLFLFSGQPLPLEWVIYWPSFFDPQNPQRFPRPIDTSLSRKLLNLGQRQISNGQTTQTNLAVRDLLRGYILRVPTGQAVARALASEGIQPLTPDQILSVSTEIPRQSEILLANSELLTHTPLWFYILAEAALYSRGHHLGPVGSTIVAEVLIGILRNSTDSILNDPTWTPTLGDTPGKFDIEDLLKLAGVY